MKHILALIFLIFPQFISAQFLSKLSADRNSALYTTYAAPISRSEYKTDQGYQLLWNDPDRGVSFISRDGPSLGIAFKSGQELRFRLGELFSEAVVTQSYSDLVNLYYYPFREIRVEVFFTVYSSTQVICRYRISNEGNSDMELNVFPFLVIPAERDTLNFGHSNLADGYTFSIHKKRDSWMVEQKIPLNENLSGLVLSSVPMDSVHLFRSTAGSSKNSNKDVYSQIKNLLLTGLASGTKAEGMIGSRSLSLAPGDVTELRVVVGLDDRSIRPSVLSRKSKPLLNLNLEELVKADEKEYSRIPSLPFKDMDREMLYWSSFSLLRQCMMPPEGECHYNYYVFSREPKWGWGYGGQVFHESLSMLAYAYMDPVSAMNSQRVYMERQQAGGYINYRTGPYLNEINEYNGQLTSSAPWYNYQNFEIYKVTKDKDFLRDAYFSGRRFYKFYVANRDSNQNGLCEWGGHAELESVRDARVAVWDKVGWPSNFEGPDVNSMLVMEANSLKQMADILGLKEESKAWKEDADKRKSLINRYCWDPVTKFYYNINKKDQQFTFRNQDDLKIKEIIGFLPFWAGVSEKDQTNYLLEKMKDPEEFWRRYGVPTLTAKSDYYNPIGYWNGPVWVQWNYLLFRGLLDHGYIAEAEELAKRVTDNMVYHLKNDHVFWEFYSADANQAGWNKTYIWAGIAARFFLDLEDFKSNYKDKKNSRL
ncbi:MAG: trehalase family glycosidase [bacterium]